MISPPVTNASSDAELVSAVVRGDPRAAQLIFRRHAPSVRATVRRSLGPDHEIDDLVQDVFLGFTQGAARLADPAALRAYLSGIARRSAALEIRRRKVRRRVSLTRTGEVPEDEAAPGGPEAHRALLALCGILDALPAQQRRVFVARHVEGLELEEAARALQLSKATVWRAGKSSLARVLERARKSSLLAEYVPAARP